MTLAVTWMRTLKDTASRAMLALEPERAGIAVE